MRRVFCFLTLVTCGDAFITRLNPRWPAHLPRVVLNAQPSEVSPGATITASWSGVSVPTSNDQIYLLPLGDAAHGPFVLGTYPTPVTGDGAMPIALPTTLAPGAYELRLYTTDPDRAPSLKQVARCEPFWIRDGPTFKGTLEWNHIFRLSVAGLSPGTYHVQATEGLNPPDWQVVGDLTVNAPEPTYFNDAFHNSRGGRFYRISK